MVKLNIHTKEPKAVVDITDQVQLSIRQHNVSNGLVHLFLSHSTAGITTADLDPGTDLDLLEAYEEMVPKLQYRHAHNPDHVSDHILSALIGIDVTVPIDHGRLVLGTWQRIVLIDFNGPKERQVVVSFLKTTKGGHR